MLRAVAGRDDDFLVSEIERAENLPGHTLGTMRALKRRYPQAELFFIMGEDNLDDFHRWHKPDELAREVTILVGYRPPHDPGREAQLPSNDARLVPTELVDVSATGIREMLKKDPMDERLDELVPAKALRYIRKHGLYQ
jgi:nicotinate-nucleotide adenylyltransferase